MDDKTKSAKFTYSSLLLIQEHINKKKDE